MYQSIRHQQRIKFCGVSFDVEILFCNKLQTGVNWDLIKTSSLFCKQNISPLYHV